MPVFFILALLSLILDPGSAQTVMMAFGVILFASGKGTASQDAADLREALLFQILPISPRKQALRHLKKKALFLIAFQVLVMLRVNLIPVSVVDKPLIMFIGIEGNLQLLLISWTLFMMGAIFSSKHVYRFNYKISAVLLSTPLLLWQAAMSSLPGQLLYAAYVAIYFALLLWIYCKVTKVFITDIKTPPGRTGASAAGSPAGNKASFRDTKVSTPNQAPSSRTGTDLTSPQANLTEERFDRQPTAPLVFDETRFDPVGTLIRADRSQIHLGIALLGLLFVIPAASLIKMSFIQLLGLNLGLLFGACPLFVIVDHYKKDHQHLMTLPVSRQHVARAWLKFMLGYLTALILLVCVIQIFVMKAFPTVLILTPAIILQLLVLGVKKEPACTKSPADRFRKIFCFSYIAFAIISNILFHHLPAAWGQAKNAATSTIPPLILFLFFVITSALMLHRTKTYLAET